MSQFFRVGDAVYPTAGIISADFSQIEKLEARVQMDGWSRKLEGNDAIELAMLLKPSILEGRRLRWLRHAWALHNLLGHPLMQLLSFFGAYKAAIWVHDATVPKPRGTK